MIVYQILMLGSMLTKIKFTIALMGARD